MIENTEGEENFIFSKFNINVLTKGSDFYVVVMNVFKAHPCMFDYYSSIFCYLLHVNSFIFDLVCPSFY
jgi:hypothetical protein